MASWRRRLLACGGNRHCSVKTSAGEVKKNLTYLRQCLEIRKTRSAVSVVKSATATKSCVMEPTIWKSPRSAKQQAHRNEQAGQLLHRWEGRRRRGHVDWDQNSSTRTDFLYLQIVVVYLGSANADNRSPHNTATSRVKSAAPTPVLQSNFSSPALNRQSKYATSFALKFNTPSATTRISTHKNPMKNRFKTDQKHTRLKPHSLIYSNFEPSV